ncbi:acyl-CoA carboxylase subunit epsilon [Nocardia sp. NBC_01388]|uniref:acyl-CoA carboxylase subunit epsilon n=1 Tax=Nocardia sp. NBC_01388 TaxID=2903596 RepID=UPI003867BAF5
MVAVIRIIKGAPSDQEIAALAGTLAVLAETSTATTQLDVLDTWAARHSCTLRHFGTSV